MDGNLTQKTAALHSRLASYIKSIPTDKRKDALSELEKIIGDFDEVDNSAKADVMKMLKELIKE